MSNYLETLVEKMIADGISEKDINALNISEINPGMYILRIKYNEKIYIKNIIKK